jgi:penicillin amidase
MKGGGVMTDFTRLGRAFGLIVGVSAGLAGIGAMAALRRSLPKTSGRVRLAGIGAQAEVRRDRWGVPHIYAETDADLFFALGYVHAQDRLWQLELNRRTGHGRLAEVFGPVALSSDSFIRTLGFSRLAHQEQALLDDETRMIMEAYVRGVNAHIEQNLSRLPLEFGVLGFQPQPWCVADLLVWPKVMALSLSANWTAELFNARLVQAIGAERAAAIAPHYPEDAPLTVPADTVYPPDLGRDLLRLAGDASAFTGETGGPQGSNAWAVGAGRSSSGKPMLANDPHLALALPGTWYAAHLEGGSFQVTGVTLPGTCGIVIGHNARIAWGVTNSMTDTQDLYIERFDPADSLRYEYRGEWCQAELVREEIKVKDQAEPELLEVRITRHGPIVDPISAPDDSPLHPQPAGDGAYREALALRWPALDASPTLARAVLGLNRAHDWDSFRTALADWSAPPQNFVYADVDGNIGYHLAGRMPVRAQSDGQLPVPGWNGLYDWQGFIPFAELPAVLNPNDGMVLTANHRISGENYPLHTAIRGEWANPYRADRIRQMLDATSRHDVRSFAEIQADVYSIPGRLLADLYAGLSLENDLERHARDLLTGWDGQLHAQSAPGAIYATLRYHVLRLAYSELADLNLAQSGLGAFSGLPGNTYLERALPAILARIAAAAEPERADPWLSGERTWNDLLAEALQITVSELRRFGNDPERWTYARIHSLTLRHPLGSVPALAPIFNRGPWPTGGDIDTVNQHYMPRDTAVGPVYNASSYRQIFDLSDWDAARAILPAGQSGQPTSRHYNDMADAWRAGGYFPLLWSRAAVERYTTTVLSLMPESS